VARMTPFGNLKRHLTGWQLAIAALGTALGGVALALPRPVAPGELPLPTVDRVELGESDAQARELVRAAESKPLPFLVRAAGEAFRRFGKAETEHDESEALAQASDFSQRVAEARKQYGDVSVLTLRAVQAELFSRAVRESKARDLEELGGAAFAERSSTREASRATLRDDELRSLFSMRWTRLSGTLSTRPFMPTLNEWRLYYRTLIAHAELARAGRESDPVTDAMALARCIDALVRHDQDYPKLLALGIVEHWKGRYDAAEALFAAHLEAERGGPWRLRTQNYLIAARRHTPATNWR
jgi:hypothetical protein